MYKILSIDGGGIRGVIPAVLLQQIEKRTKRPVAELFDLVVGTSTGGILAAGLTVPKSRTAKTPKFTAEDMLALYVERGCDIFERSFWRGVTSCGGVTDEQYDHRPLEKLLKEYLGDATLADCLAPIVVTSYDIEEREPYFFKTRLAREVKDRNHMLRDVARATSAAPTYFEPVVTPSMAQRSTRRVLVDGGVFANNPAMCGFSEAVSQGIAPADMLVVSLGTGVATREIPYEDARNWGLLGWVRPILSVMMDGQADSADYHLRQMVPPEGDGRRYFRFDTPLELALDDLDAANAGNIRNLVTEAEQIVETEAAALDGLVALLTA
ncbi:MAG: CBASS cGAMP-activated phospholipase [Acetobacterales bacterium]